VSGGLLYWLRYTRFCLTSPFFTVTPQVRPYPQSIIFGIAGWTPIMLPNEQIRTQTQKSNVSQTVMSIKDWIIPFINFSVCSRSRCMKRAVARKNAPPRTQTKHDTYSAYCRLRYSTNTSWRSYDARITSLVYNQSTSSSIIIIIILPRHRLAKSHKYSTLYPEKNCPLNISKK